MNHLDTASEWFPLSSAQRSRWFLYQVDEEGRGAHNNGFAVRLHGAIDVDGIGCALNKLAARHAMLRASFRVVQGEPEQKVVPDVAVPVFANDAQDWPAAVLQQRVTLDRNKPFDLQHGPLVRAHVYHTAADQAVLLLVFDHLACDGWSYWQMLDELGTLLVDPAAEGAPPSKQQYRDYIDWQRNWVDSPAGQAQWQYWEKSLGTELPVLQLATDRPAAGAAVQQGASHSMFCAADLTGQLRALAQKEACSLFVVLLTAYQIVLHRHTGQDDIVVGTPMPGRSKADWDRVTGDFVNPIAVRSSFAGRPNVRQLLSRVRTSTLRGMQNQDYPFDLLVEKLQPRRHLTAAPIFQTMFTLQKARQAQDLLSLWAAPDDQQDVQWGGYLASGYPVSQSGGARGHGLALEAIELGSLLRFDLRYNSALFDVESIERFAAHFRNVLRAMVASQEAEISALPMLEAVERERLLVGFNDTAMDHGGAQLLHQCFEEQVRQRPEALALVHGQQNLSYAALNERANRLAHHLIAMGVRPDQRVAICTERGIDMIVAVLATLKAGGAYVPLDPAYPAERLAFMLSDSAPLVLITQAALPALSGAPSLVLDDPTTAAVLAAQPSHNPDPLALGLGPEHLAYVIYTSGSTGKPKGVMNQHRAICNFGMAQVKIFGVTPASRVLQFASLSFDASLMEITMAYCAGASLYLGERDALLPGEPLLRLLKTHGITHMLLPASALAACGAPQQLAAMTVILGGDVLPAALARQWAACHQVFNAYGPTEAAICAATFRCHAELHDAVPIGHPVANASIYILDGAGQPVPQGVVGEIHIGGAGVARGYLNRPELTAERFLDDPFSTLAHARMYRTGDLGRYLADGSIAYLGRNDFQVKLRGFRIELGEIETRLQAIDGVAEALVVARDDRTCEKRLVAYVVAGAGAAPSAADLRTKLLAVMPEHMVPSAFVMLDAIPLTSNGKLDRQALPAPDMESMSRHEYQAPHGAIETVLAQIWQDLLGLDEVGRYDEFFALGGHSLLAMRMLSRVREQLGVEVAVRELFKAPSLAGFAGAVAHAGTSGHRAIAAVDRRQPLPLSWAQQRLWFLDQLDSAASAAYHMAAGFRLSGALDREALKATFDCIVARHESLRTCFVLEDGVAVQKIAAPELGFSLQLQDVSELHGHELDSAILRIGMDEALTPFDLASGPLIRGRLLRVAEQEHVLFITQHHIISDGWSVGVLVQEVGALYGAFSQGLADPLPRLAIQYPDYAVWQRQYLQGEALQSQLSYWTNQLQGVPALLAMPADRARPVRQSFAGDVVSFSLDAGLSAGLRALGQQHGTTLFMTMLAGWSMLLSRMSGQDDVVVGSPIANRQHGETEGLIGFFANTLALRVRLENDPSVASVLAQVKATTLAAYSHQDLPFEQVVEAVNPVRSMAHGPLFQAMLTLNNTPGSDQLALPGLSVRPVGQAQSSALCDLMLSLSEQGAVIGGSLLYASDLFDRATMARLLEHFKTLLGSMVAAPQARLSELALINNQDRAHLLALNPAPVAYPQDVLVHQLFEQQAAQQPQAIALVFGEQRLSYQELNERANQLANALLARGIGREDRVAISLERSVEMVVGILAVLKAGAAYVPLDPGYPPERLAYMYADSSPAVLLTQSWLQHGLPVGECALYLDQPQQFSAQPMHNPVLPALRAGDLAYVIYTSGSTGVPKGVMIEHGNVLNLVHWAIDSFGREQLAGTVCSTSINFDLSVYELFAPLACGCSVTLVRDILDTPQALVGASLINTVPSAAQALHNMALIPASVRNLNVAGEPLKRQLAERLLNETQVERLCNLYGPTETTTYSTWVRMDRTTQFLPHIGAPVANTQVYILDQALGLQPMGVVGEIYIGGAGVTRGYMNQEDLTRARYLPDPFSATAGARMYKTGDLGRWLADGNIEYLGRNDFQVKVRGFRIELGEIEFQLGLCAGVAEAAVMAREDVPGDLRLVAYVVPHAGQAPTLEQMREHLAHSLADYMVPNAFVVLDEFPLTPNGKLDRKALPVPDQASGHDAEYEAPQDETEAVLVQIWHELLGSEKVGRHDSFFMLGGHSLLAVQAISRIREKCGVEVALRELFNAPTPAGMANVVKRSGTAERSAIVPAKRGQKLLLSFAQQRLWFLDQLEGGSPQYNMPMALRVQGEFDEVLAERALVRIIERHEPLRTVFVNEGDEPQQLILAGFDFKLQQVDLRGLDPMQQEAQVEAAAKSDAVAGFDLAHDLMLRATFLHLDEKNGVLLFNMHHIASDGWSMALLVKEFLALYDALGHAQPDPLPPLTISYTDYAQWQRNWLAGDVLERQLRYWGQQLADLPSVHGLPLDRPRPAQQSYRGATHAWKLDRATHLRLQRLARERGVTMFMLLHGALSVLLARHGNSADIVIGTPVANRLQKELEDIIGFFVNTLVLRSDCSTNHAFVDFLDVIKSVNLDAQANQDVPFETLVERLNPERSARHSQLFQIMFTMDANVESAMNALAASELKFAPLSSSDAMAKFELTFNASEGDDGLALSINYNTDLFDAATIGAMAGRFDILLNGIAAAPATPIHDLPLLGSEEKLRLLGLNALRAECPAELCIHELFEAQAERTPDNVAIVFEEERLSYSELNARANQMAHYLRDQGVHADCLVGVCVERSIDMVIALLGILKAGGAYVPLDLGYPQNRLAYMVENSGMTLLLTQKSLADRAAELTPPGHIVTMLEIDGGDLKAALAAYPVENCVRREGQSSHNLAYVIYTSGSTGLPKGVMAHHAGVVNFLYGMLAEMDVRESDAVLVVATIGFDVSILELYMPLVCGGRMVLVPDGCGRDVDALQRSIAEHNVSIVQATPMTWQMLVTAGWTGVPGLKALVGGEALTTALASEICARVGVLWNVYGPTETTVWTTLQRIAVDNAGSVNQVSIGRAIANARMYVLDQRGQLAPFGTEGELYIGGAGVSRGYCNRPELTAERFVADPFAAGLVYKTGDMARYLPNGELEYVGRNDFQVKIRGFRIELGEIENCLAQHDNVSSAVVLAREDVPGEKRLVAYVTVKGGDTDPVASLKAHLHRALPEYMVPALFVVLDAFPVTHNGKVDKRLLPAPDVAALHEEYIAPRNASERALAQIWADLLDLELHTISASANFFALGGHSLLAIRVLAQVRQHLGIELDIKDLFNAPSLESMAALIDAGVGRITRPLVRRIERQSNSLPLSFAQQRLWLLDRLENGSAQYNMPLAMTVEGRFSEDFAEQAFQRIIERHEPLRTVFTNDDGGQPLQVIRNAFDFTLKRVDLQALDPAQQAAAVRLAARTDAVMRFDLASDLMLRSSFLRLGAERGVLLLNMHHIASDGWSMALLAKEFLAQYDSLDRGNRAMLPSLGISYADYSQWQRNWFAGEAMDRQLGYWDKQLAELPTVHGLPLDRPRPAQQRYRGANHTWQLDPGTYQGLNRLARERGATMFMVLHAALSVLLARHANNPDVVIGTPVANRLQKELEDIIGFFANTLVLRTDCSGNPDFLNFLDQVKAVNSDAQANQDVPFEYLVERLKPSRSAQHNALFQIMFSMNTATVAATDLVLDGVHFVPLSDEDETAKFELTFNASETGQGIAFTINFNTDLFDVATVAGMARRFNTLLRAIAATPATPIHDLPLLDEAEMLHLRHSLNATQRPFTHENLIHELFEAQVERAPANVAVVHEQARLSYAELNARANQLAQYLRERGVGPDSLVGLCVERSIDMVVGLMGILKAGGAYVPLDPGYPQNRLAYMVESSGMTLLLTQTALADRVAALAPGARELGVIDLDCRELQQKLLNYPDANCARGAGQSSRNLAYVIYTSGSTGLPKGVMVEHRALVNRIEWMQQEYLLTASDVVLQKTPFSFDVSVWELTWPFIAGASLVMAKPDGHKDPSYLCSTIQQHGVTTLHFVPSMLQAMLGDSGWAHCSTVRHVFCSGEALAVDTVSRHYALHQAPLHNLYGPTEAAIDVSFWACEKDHASHTIPIGKPIQNIVLYVLDEQRNLIPQGTAGELYIGGVGLARGYLNRPELTDERFISNPFYDAGDPSSSERLYRTGDLVRHMADGNIEYLGRMDDQVKIRGFRIELGEIESRLVQHPQVDAALVLAREDAPGDKRLVAYVTLSGSLPDPAASLKSHLQVTLPDYMVPAHYVMLDTFPLTPNGKADKKALPAPCIGAMQPAYLAPGTDTEILLAAIWSDLLHVEAGEISSLANFFAMGGHSLLVIQMLARLQRAGIHTDVRAIFAAPDLKALAETLDQEKTFARRPFTAPENRIPAHCARITPDMLTLIDLDQRDIDQIAKHIPGGAQNIQDIYPLAPLQEGILFHHLLHAQSDPYIMPLLMSVETTAQREALLAALQATIDRHDVLRTAIVWQQLAQPVQVVCREASLPVREIALDPAADARAQMLEKMAAPQGMNLNQAPLLCASVAKDPLSERCYVLLQLHHIISDHIGLEIIFSEVSAHLAATTRQLMPTVPYREFVAHVLHQARASDAEAFFTRQFASVSEPTAPYDLLEVHGNGSAIAELRKELDATLARKIRLAARESNVSPATLFHAAWAMVLAASSGRDDVVFGTVFSGRLQGTAGAAHTMGMFMNTLPMRLQLQGQSVRQFVQQTEGALVDLLPYEQAPLALAQRCSGLPSGVPLFSAMFNYRHSAVSAAVANDYRAVQDSGIAFIGAMEKTNYPFTISIDDLGEGFAVDAQVDRSVDVGRVVGHIEAAMTRLVDALQGEPAQQVLSLSVLPQSEQDHVLLSLNSSQVHYPQDKLMHQLFEARAAAQAGTSALEHAGQVLTYGELNARANQVAHALLDMGVKPDDRVAICAGRGVEVIVAMLAVLKAGASYVPLDPSYPEERLAFMLADCAPVALLVDPVLAERLGESAVPALPLSPAGMGQQPTHNPVASSVGVQPDHLAYVIYTSGSTGLPKGVLIEHRNAVNFIYGQIGMLQLETADRVLQFASFGFDSSIAEIFPALCAGATVVLRPDGLMAPDQAFIDFLAEQRITVADLPTAFWHQWAHAVARQQAWPPATLRTLVVSGEQAESRHLATWSAMMAEQGGRWINNYGPTEATVNATSIAYDGSSVVPAGPIPIGRPVANAQVYVLDANLLPVPVGAIGEIHIGGHGVARGYLNRPELTAQRFIADPFNRNPASRLYKTGDLGRWLADGTLVYEGRNDFQVKLRGHRIELGEIESLLVQCDGVREAVLIARSEAGDTRLVAYVVADAVSAPTVEQMHRHLMHSLPNYMVPSAFVLMDALPLTPNGKLDRKALPAPDLASVQTRDYEEPQGEIEATLAQIWQELLGLEKIGRNDEFFALGGHSLLAVQVLSRLRERLGVEVPLRGLFDAPELAGFSRLVANAGKSELGGIVAVERDRQLPLSWAQQRLWFLDQLDDAAGAAYNSPTALRMKGTLDEAALQNTLDSLVARHESLRTHFVLADGEPVQVVALPDIGFPLVKKDLSALDTVTQVQAVGHIAGEEGEHHFDLACGPLVRGVLLRLAHDEHVLLLTVHHIVTDGWSERVLVKEFCALYAAFCSGKPDPLPPLSIQYADYAVWQRGWLQGEVLDRQLGFWKEHLAEAPALLELPTDRPRPAVQSYAGKQLTLELPPELTAGLRALSLRHGTSLFMTMLAGWAVLLARISGQDEVVVGTPIANRHRAETENLIGFFVNTLALRVSLDAALSVEQLLAQVKATTLAAYDHQDLPFEQVVEAIRPARSMDHSPIFQAMLTMNNVPEQGELALPGLILSDLGLERNSIHFDLHLTLTEIGDSLTGVLSYASDLFDAATVERLAQQFQTLLAAMVAQPGQSVLRLPLLDGAAKQQLVDDFNATAAALPAEQLLSTAFEAQVLAQPDALAVVYGDDSLSYAQLNMRANLVAQRLLAQGVRPDDCVALCVERSVEMLVGIVGIWKAGAAYVPMDPANPADRLAYLLADCAPVALLTQSGLRERLPELSVPVFELDGAALRQGEAGNPDPAALGLTTNNLAYVIYTSGSTGAAKGVMVEHHSALNFWSVMRASTHEACPSQARIALNASFAFDMSLKGILQLLSGHCVHIVPQSVRADGAQFLAFLERHRIDAFDCTPSQLELLLAAGLLEEGSYQPGQVLIGGEAINAATWDRLRQAQTPAFFNMYGPTEATVDATIGRIQRDELRAHIGRPVANARIYILDRLGQPVPVGVSGEIHIGGAGVARGYLQRPELTAERFIAAPFAEGAGARLYRTGDVGRWLADGRIEYQGRNDFQVKLRGYRIELGEIEAALLACQGVREAVVLAREDVPGEKRLVAYLVGQEAAASQIGELRQHLATVLAEYMVPSAFVVLEQLPLTRNGKLDRRALPAPDQDSLATGEYEAPQGEVEMELASIWRDLLKVEKVGRHDDFFALGGHSLLAALAISRISSNLSVELPMVALFKNPTLKTLGEAIVELTLEKFAEGDIALAAADLDDLSEEEVILMLERERALLSAPDQTIKQ